MDTGNVILVIGLGVWLLGDVSVNTENNGFTIKLLSHRLNFIVFRSMFRSHGTIIRKSIYNTTRLFALSLSIHSVVQRVHIITAVKIVHEL
jgi:hypothetical protein